MNIQDDTIFVSGHRGMVGSAIVRALEHRGVEQILTCPRSDLDLTVARDVATFLADHKPDTVIVGAAKVGGIYANDTYPAEFIFDNLAIAINLIHGAYEAGVARLLFLGSSCIYPRQALQPIKEDYLLTGPLEPTNEAYAIAKIAGMKMCQYYRKQYGVLYHSGMPTNLYGPGDNYHAENSHVIPALIRRFHEAMLQGLSAVTIWGTGQPRREFLHVEDLAQGILTLLENPDPPDVVNLGCGEDISIAELADLVKEAVGYEGIITYDATKPDGMPRKLLDIARIRSMGWAPRIELAEGLKQVYVDFCQGYREA